MVPAAVGLGFGALLGAGMYLVLRRPRGEQAEPAACRSCAVLAAIGVGAVGVAAGAVVARKLEW